jgi:hypothetical protein
VPGYDPDEKAKAADRIVSRRIAAGLAVVAGTLGVSSYFAPASAFVADAGGRRPLATRCRSLQLLARDDGKRLIPAVCYAGGTMRGARFRVITAALCAVLAVAFFVTDPNWNAPNVLMSLATLVSIAALVMPPILRRNAHATDRPKATPRRSA